jgi:hypothetical protein
MSLDLDAAGVETDEGMRDGACEHVVTLDINQSHGCHRTVTKVELPRPGH